MAEARSAGARRVAVSRLHRSGAGAQRVLVVGDGSFVVDPLPPSGERLVDLIADGVAARTGRGVDVDVMWDLAPALDAVGSATEAWRLWRYEAVVVVVEEQLLLEAGRRWPGRISRLAHRVIPELAEASGVVVVRLRPPGDAGPFPAIGAGATSLSFVPLALADDGGVPDPAAYADAIAGRLARLLGSSRGRSAEGNGRTAAERRSAPEAETERQRAVDRVSEHLGGITPDLERVVLLARNTFDVPFVQVNLLDRGRIRTLAFVGVAGDGAEHPLCSIAVRGAGPTIIADTWDDPRLDANPHVHGGDFPVRFYAAHPIESEDGYRVGTLCVFDIVPHDRHEVDATVLRDLALLAEAEISTLPAET